ncbi:MAG: helix-turn-helix domain-containing protein [Acidimicrobiales bacterium]
MSELTSWNDIKKERSPAGQAAYEDEARISEFRELVYRLRTEAGLTQAELAGRMGTTQSAIARMEGPTTGPRGDTQQPCRSAPPNGVSSRRKTAAVRSAGTCCSLPTRRHRARESGSSGGESPAERWRNK